METRRFSPRSNQVAIDETAREELASRSDLSDCFRRRFAITLFVVSVGVAGVAIGFFRSAVESERETLIKLARRNSPAIGGRLTEFVTQHPEDAEVVELLVAWHLRENSPFVVVEPFLMRLSELRPNDPDLWKTRAILRGRNGQPEECLSDGLHVLSLSPDDNETRKLVIAVAGECGQHAIAFREARKLYESHRFPRRDAGTILIKTCLLAGDIAHAQEIVDECFPPADSDDDGKALRAQVFQAAARHGEAVALFRSLSQNSLVYREFALFRLSQSLVALRKDEEAKAALAELERVKSRKRAIVDAAQRPDDLQAQVRAADVLLEEGRATEAVAVLELAITRFGKESSLVSRLVLALRNAGQADRANRWEQIAVPVK